MKATKIEASITFEKGHSWKTSSEPFKKAMLKMIRLAYKINQPKKK